MSDLTNVLFLILLLLLPFVVGIVLVVTSRAGTVLYRFAERKLEKLDAETHLLEEQAAHVNQTAQVEKSTLEATIKAYEKQGANKLRTEIARNLGDRAKLEALLGSKLDPLFKGYVLEGKVEEPVPSTNPVLSHV